MTTRSEHRRIGRRVATGLIALALAATTAVLPRTPAVADSGSTLTVATNAITTFNPFLAYAQSELNILSEVYPTLVWGDEHSQPTHYLADSWTTSPDKLTWTFKLHPNLKWSDGQPITASDAAWTINLVMTNETAATANGSLVENFASVTAPDDTTLVVKTKKPQANLLYNIGGVPIVPEHIWKSKVANLKDFTNEQFPVVGYGPYQLVGYVADQYATLKANKDFFQGAPKYDTLIAQYFKNTDAAVAALRSGQVDQVDQLTATQYQALSKDSDIVTYQQVGYRWTGVEVNPGARSKTGKLIPGNTANPALADPVLRKAMAYGIDRQTLVTKVLDGLGQVGAGYLPPAFPDFWWKPSSSDMTGYDPAKANQLLDQAGYKKGSDGIRTDPKTGKELSFRLGTHSDSITDSQIANYLVGWMRDIGIKLTIQSQSYDALNANLAKGDWDLLMDSWSTGPDPTYLLSIQTCGVLPDDKGANGNTDAFYCNKNYDQLYQAQQGEFDKAKRSQDIREMQQMLYAANNDIILYYGNDLAAVQKDAAKGFIFGQKNDAGFYPYQNVTQAWIAAVPPANSSSSSSNTGLIIGIVVAVVVVVLAAGGFFMYRRRTAATRK